MEKPAQLYFPFTENAEKAVANLRNLIRSNNKLGEELKNAGYNPYNKVLHPSKGFCRLPWRTVKGFSRRKLFQCQANRRAIDKPFSNRSANDFKVARQTNRRTLDKG